MLKVGLHHRSPRVVELEIGLHHGCYGNDQEIFNGGEVIDGASLRESQGDEIHNGASPWKFQK